MSSQLTRRDWLRASGFLTAGLSLSRFTPAEAARPNAPFAENFVNEFAFATDDPFEKMLKLHTRLFANENPLGIAQSAKDAIAKAAEIGNRYAWMEFGPLKQLISGQEGVTPKQIMMSPGSSQILLAAAEHFAKGGGTILTCRPTYDDLLEKTTKFGATFKGIAVTKDYKF